MNLHDQCNDCAKSQACPVGHLWAICQYEARKRHESASVPSFVDNPVLNTIKSASAPREDTRELTVRYCPECGTEIAPTGWGCHHSASCTISDKNFNDPAESTPEPRKDDRDPAFYITQAQAAEWHTLLVKEETENAALRAELAAKRARAVADCRLDALDAFMYSVCKWLPDNYVEANPETAAADAREIALKAIEAAEAEAKRLREALEGVQDKAEGHIFTLYGTEDWMALQQRIKDIEVLARAALEGNP